MSNKPDIRIKVGAEKGLSTEILKEDLINIFAKFNGRKTSLFSVAVGLNKEVTKVALQEQLQEVLSKVKLSVKVDLDGAKDKVNSSKSKVGSRTQTSKASEILDVNKLQKQVAVGENVIKGFYYGSRQITEKLKKDFSALGEINLSNTFDDEGKISTLSVELLKANGEIEKFKYNTAKIKTGNSVQEGWVYDSTSSKDSSLGKDLLKESNELYKEQLSLLKAIGRSEVELTRTAEGSETESALKESINIYKEKKTAIENEIKALGNLSNTKKNQDSINKQLLENEQKLNVAKSKVVDKKSDIGSINTKGVLKSSEDLELLEEKIKSLHLAAKKTTLDFGESEDLDRVKESLKEIDSQFEKVKNSSDTKEQKLAYDQLNDSLKITSATISNVRKGDIIDKKQVDSVLQYSNGILVLKRNAESYLSVNDRINNSLYKESYDNFLMKLSLPQDNGGFKTVKDATNEYKRLQAGIRETGAEGQSMWQKIQNAYKKFGGWTIVTATLGIVKRQFKEMVDVVKELDASLIELQKVSNLSGDSLSKFVKKAFDIAPSANTTGKDILDATATFKKAGYDLDESFKYSIDSSKMLAVGDGITDVKEASSALIAVLKGFKSSDSGEIIDIINEISNTSAIDFENITDGLKRASGTLSQTGTTLAETAGLLTGGFSQLRDIETVSSGLVMISQRLRGIGEDGEAVSGLSAKLQKDFKEIANIDIEDGEGGLRSTYDILSDMARIMPTLTEQEQQYLGGLAAGNNRVKVLNAIISGWGDVSKAIDSANNSAGSADKELALVTDGIEGRTTALKNKFQELSNEVISSDLIKVVISISEVLTTRLTKSTSAIGGIGTALAAITLGFGLFGKQIGIVTSMNKELFILGKNVKDIDKGFNKGWNDKDNKNIFSKFLGGIKGATAPVKISNPLIESDKKAMIEYNKVLSQTSYTQLELDNTLKSSTETAKMYAQSFNGAAINVDGYTGTIKSATFASKALAAASVALNMAIAAAAGFAISKIIEYSQAQKQAAEEERRDADENSKTSQEKIKGLNDLIKEYKTLASQTSLTEDNKSRLLEIQNKLIDTFGLEAEGIDLVNKKYDEQIDKIENLKEKALKDAVQTAQADYNVKSSDTSYNEKAKWYSPLIDRGDIIYNRKQKDEDYQFLLGKMQKVYTDGDTGLQYRIGDTLMAAGAGRLAKTTGTHKVEDLIKDLDTAISMLEEGGQKSGNLYAGLVNYRKEQQEVLDLYNDSKSVLAQTTFDLYTLNNPIENVTTENYKEWHDNLLLLAGKDEELKKDLIELSVKLFPDKDYQFELKTPKQREDDYKQSKLNGTYDESSKASKASAEAVKTVTEELEDESISLERVNQLLQLKNLTDEEQNSLLEKQAELLESTESQISSLNGAIETLANGNKLSADEIYDLIQLYPELATNVKSLGDGYIIENDALKLVRDAHIDTALSTREAQLQTTFNVLEETANRIGLYEDEITAIQSVADAQNLLAKINEDNANRRPSGINSMADYEAFKRQGSPSNEVKNQLEDYISQREALELLQNELYGKLGTSGDGSGSGSGGSGGSGSDPYLKAFEDSKKELDHLRKMDVYDDWQYYLELEKLSDSYFKGKMDYLDEYYQYSSEVYTSLKDLYKKTLEEEKSKLQEVNAEEERKLSLKKAYDNYIKAQNDKMKVYYEDRGFVDEANKNDVETARLELQKQLTAQKVSEIDSKIKNLDDVPNNYYTDPKTGSNVPPSFLKPLTQADLDNLISASPALNTITKNFDLTGALFNPDAMNQVQNVTNTDNKRVVVNLSIDKIVTENPEDFANQMSDIVSNKFLEILDGTLLQSENH